MCKLRRGSHLRTVAYVQNPFLANISEVAYPIPLELPVTTSLGLIKLDLIKLLRMCQLINLIDWNSHDVVVV